MDYGAKYEHYQRFEQKQNLSKGPN
jgi:hypothetical protein